MRKTTVARGLLFLGIAGLAGCANSDYAQSRKTREGVTINGSQFAPAEENDQNAFGRESDGLSTNPKTKPSKEDLGEAGKLCSNKSSLTGDPVGVDAFVNEVVDVKFVLEGVEKTLKGCDSEDLKSKPLAGRRVVIVLERPDGADGVIDFISDPGNKVISKTATKIIANTDKNGEVHVRLYTGSMYSKNPMYYINAWQADVEMAAIEVNIKKLPQKSDGDFFEGSKDTANDLTPPPGYSKIESNKAFVEIVNEDPLKQELFVDGRKRLRVKLLGAETATSDALEPVDSEGICWKFVSKRESSPGVLDGNSASVDKVMGSDSGDQAGCSKTDTKGNFWVEITTGAYYNERYFLNFFHPKATPVSYQIDTFIAPDTLGEQGNDAEITTTVSKDIDDPGGKFDSGKFDKTDTKTLIDQIFGADPCSEPVRSIYEQCYDPQCTFTCPKTSDDEKCSSEFKCTFEKNPDGTWSIIDKDGKPVKADLDGDCNCNDTEYTPDLKCSLPEKVTCSEGVCKGSGKACLDNINVVLDKGKDDKGNDTIVNKGVDTDGDGKVDVAPDECAATPRPAGCDADYRFVWSDDVQQHFYNQKLSTPIGEEFPVYVKTRYKTTSATNKSDVTGVMATLKRGSYPSNDAMLRIGSKDVENMAFSISGGEPAPIKFWSGKAFGALYYIQLRHNGVLPANIPIATSNVINMPSGEGDSPDDSVLKEGGEAVTPPSDMGKPDPNLGHCTLFVDPDEVEKVKNSNGEALLTMTKDALNSNKSLATSSIETPIARTLVLNAALVCDRGTQQPSIVKNVKTYWKLTRGKSTYNNGTLLSTVKATDYTGVASSQFYAGTGYGATYYVSVFHPNATQDASCKKDCKTRPAVFEIKVNDSKGSIPGPSEKDDPILPGDTTGTDKDGKKGICCNTDNAESLGVCDPNPCTEEAVNCNDALKRTYIYCDKDKGTETHGEKPDVNKSLPTVACNVADFPDCLKDSGECRDFAGNVIGEDDGDPTKKFVAGCMLLSFEGDDPLRSYIGTLQSVKVKLQQRTLNGIESVADTVYVTANKAPEADGAFTSDKQRTSSKHGTTVFFFKTGSVITSYKLSVSHPNYVDDTGLMIPVSKMLHIVDKSLLETKPADINLIRLSVDGAETDGDVEKKVVYHVISSDYNKCDSKFALNTRDGVQKNCEAAQGPTSWSDPKKNNGVQKKSMCAVDGDLSTSMTVNVPDSQSRYMAYAVQYNSKGTPIKYGCVDNQYLNPRKCTEEGKDDDGNDICKKYTAELGITIPLNDIPYVLRPEYNIKSLIDIGPLIEVPDSCDPKNDKSIGCVLRQIKNLYNQYLSDDPGEKVLFALEKYFFPVEMFDDVFSAEQLSSVDKKTDGCLGVKGFGKTSSGCKDANGNLVADLRTTATMKCCDKDGKTESACKDPDVKDKTCKDPQYAYSKPFYGSSSCACAKIYHYTAGQSEKCPTCNKLGGKLRPLVLKGLKALINSGFKKANLEDNLCKVVDSIQYIELQGNASFNTKNGNSAIGVTMLFNGVKIPYANIEATFEGGRVIKGTTQKASLTPETNSLMIPDMGMTLSYGELVLDIFGKLVPGAVEDGKLKLNGIINCGKLLGIKESGIKIPIVNMTITPDEINFVCGIGLKFLDDKVVDFAEQQFINTNLNLSGSAELANDGCSDSVNGACYSDSLKNGLWSGKGSMSGKQAAITGVWAAGKTKDSVPELTYGDKTLDAYMAEHSVCRKVLSKDEDKIETTNQACLGGSFDNPAGRVSNNKCSNDACKGQDGIVVCTKEGAFNALYASASAAEIIKAANKDCLGKTQGPCTTNPEIINGGNGLTNKDCMGHYSEYKEQCDSNPSIAVGADETGKIDYIVANCCDLLDCDPSKYSSLTHDCVSDNTDGNTYLCDKNWKQTCSTRLCSGQCNTPACVMNSEVTNCKDVDDSGNEVVAPKPAVIVASWRFDDVSKKNELDDAMKNATFEGGYTGELKLTFVEPCNEKASYKLVTGSDGALGAIGTDANASDCKQSSDLKKGYLKISGNVDKMEITRVTFNVMGVGRKIVFGEGDEIDQKSNLTATSDAAWQNMSIDIEDGKNLNVYIAPAFDTKTQETFDKLMRIDDIVIYARESTTEPESAPKPTPEEGGDNEPVGY